MKWYAFFSQSGSEILEVSNRLGIKPDKVFTNRKTKDGINKELLNNFDIEFIDHNDLDDVFSRFKIYDDIITLHGYLRIIPDFIAICYNIYNGHPGWITKYPELKGKDPQKKAWSLKHTTFGSVIHKVTPEVDDGEVLKERTITLTEPFDTSTVIKELHKVSIDLWVEFLTEKVKEQKIVEEIEKTFPETTRELRNLQKEEYKLFCKKQYDYGTGNISVGLDLDKKENRTASLSNLIFRCNDKVQRLLNLVVVNKREAQNEPVMDAFDDLSLYSKIAKIVEKGYWGK